MDNLQYRQETLFFHYIELLRERKDNLLIFISAKDTPGMSINGALCKQLQSLGLRSDFMHLHWNGYCAVINRGCVIEEKAIYNQIAECDGTVENIKYYVLSGPLNAENKSIISINDFNYSINSRGLNFVVYDHQRECVTDCVAFDTHMPNIPAIRSATQLESNINRQMNDLTVTINGLEKEVQKSSVFSIQMLWQLFRKPNENIEETKKRFFHTFEDNNEKLHLVHLCLVRILSDFDRICRENDLCYWIDYGALLGAYRHGKCVPWDDDLDVGMMREDIYRLRDILKDDPHYRVAFLQAYLDGYIRFVRFMTTDPENPCFIDIFFNDYCDDDSNSIWEKHCEVRRETVALSYPLRRQIQGDPDADISEKVFAFLDEQVEKEQKVVHQSGRKDYIFWATDNFSFWTKNIFAHDDLFPLKKVTIDNVECFAPNQIEKRLNQLYGDFYALPNDIGRKHIDLGDAQIEAIKRFLERE